jgi:hypothetical protein
MRNTNLARRLEQIEADLTTTADLPVLKITVTRIGKPDRMIELRMPRAGHTTTMAPWMRWTARPGIEY